MSLYFGSTKFETDCAYGTESGVTVFCEITAFLQLQEKLCFLHFWALWTKWSLSAKGVFFWHFRGRHFRFHVWQFQRQKNLTLVITFCENLIRNNKVLRYLYLATRFRFWWIFISLHLYFTSVIFFVSKNIEALSNTRRQATNDTFFCGTLFSSVWFPSWFLFRECKENNRYKVTLVFLSCFWHCFFFHFKFSEINVVFCLLFRRILHFFSGNYCSYRIIF